VSIILSAGVKACVLFFLGSFSVADGSLNHREEGKGVIGQLRAAQKNKTHALILSKII